MVTSEDVLFIMPRDQEMQFPAMSGLQRWVNDYQIKMQANCVTPEMPHFRFRYEVRMPEDDWQFFMVTLGLELKQMPEQIAFPDAVIDLSDARLMAFYNSSKHCGQIVSALCGVEAPPMPKCRTVDIGVFSGWVYLLHATLPFGEIDHKVLAAGYQTTWLTESDWLDMPGCVSGLTTSICVGYQSRETYAVASMGLPVIEILPRSRGVNWLSKFKNPLYRLIEEDHLDRLPGAIASIEQTMQWIVEHRKCQSSAAPAGTDAIRTAPIELSAPTASST